MKGLVEKMKKLMAGSSLKSPVPALCGDGFRVWSKKMKRHLISEGLWYSVEEGYKMPKHTERLTAKKMEELKEDITNDATALFLIHQSLSSPILMRIVDAKTAKEAWDTLHTIFLLKKKMNEPVRASENGSSTKTVNEPPHASKNESFSKVMKSSNRTFDAGDDRVMPLSGDEPFFDILLMKSAVKPLCHMNFPTRVDSLLPSTNVKAKVRLFGKVHEIFFYGERKQKSLGSGWRQLVDEHDLEEGDFLVFEVVESNDSKVELNLQILKSTIPPELEEEILRRKLKSRAVVNVDDDNDDDDDQ